MRIRDASDFVTRKQLQLTYQTYASTSTANAFMGDLVNSAGAYLQYREGLKEQRDPLISNAVCTSCTGLPFSLNPTSGYPWTFRNRY